MAACLAMSRHAGRRRLRRWRHPRDVEVHAKAGHSSVKTAADSSANPAGGHYVVGATGILKTRQLVIVPPEVADVVASFAGEYGGSLDAPRITGQRIQVYMTGVGSEAFADYVQRAEHRDIVLGFLESLRLKLMDVAHANDGKLSEDILALVGAGEMQVPHVDLLRGQVQVIVGLTQTQPTLVFDPKAEIPTAKEVAQYIGVDEGELRADAGLGMLLHGASPLVLPVSQIYENMVYACNKLSPGDAVQISDGIVHAGPHCKERLNVPRIVVFATYTSRQTEQYDVGCQVKLWDWASHPAVPAMVSYRRLLEVYEFGQKHNMDIRPWLYCPPERMEACEILCKIADLEESRAMHLVEQWRG